IGESVRDDILIVGATREDDPDTDMGRVFAACPGTAKDVLKRKDLEDGEVAMLSHRAREAELETTSPDQARLYYGRIRQKLQRFHTDLLLANEVNTDQHDG